MILYVCAAGQSLSFLFHVEIMPFSMANRFARTCVSCSLYPVVGLGRGGCAVEMAHFPVEKQLKDSKNCALILQLPVSEYSVT